MIAHILETARASELFDVIHVSTEDEAIRNTVERLGFKIDFPRPAILADDLTPLMPVLKYVTEAYAERGQSFDEVWLLMPCASFVEPSDLHEAADLLRRAGGRRAVLAVSPYPVAIERAFIRGKDGALTPVNPGVFKTRTQDLEAKYFNTGTFAAYPTAMIHDSEGAGTDTDFVGYVLQRDRAIDIDDESDWALAESTFHHVTRSRGVRPL